MRQCRRGPRMQLARVSWMCTAKPSQCAIDDRHKRVYMHNTAHAHTLACAYACRCAHTHKPSQHEERPFNLPNMKSDSSTSSERGLFRQSHLHGERFIRVPHTKSDSSTSVARGASHQTSLQEQSIPMLLPKQCMSYISSQDARHTNFVQKDDELAQLAV